MSKSLTFAYSFIFLLSRYCTAFRQHVSNARSMASNTKQTNPRKFAFLNLRIHHRNLWKAWLSAERRKGEFRRKFFVRTAQSQNVTSHEKLLKRFYADVSIYSCDVLEFLWGLKCFFSVICAYSFMCGLSTKRCVFGKAEIAPANQSLYNFASSVREDSESRTDNYKFTSSFCEWGSSHGKKRKLQ